MKKTSKMNILKHNPRFEKTPLNYAIRKSSTEIVKLLIDGGANVNQDIIDMKLS